jgi:hypothetical protein
MLVIIQFHPKMHGPYSITKNVLLFPSQCAHIKCWYLKHSTLFTDHATKRFYQRLLKAAFSVAVCRNCTLIVGKEKKYLSSLKLSDQNRGPHASGHSMFWELITRCYKRPGRGAEQRSPSGVQIKKDLLYHQLSEAPSQRAVEVNTRTILPLLSILSWSDICLPYWVRNVIFAVDLSLSLSLSLSHKHTHTHTNPHPHTLSVGLLWTRDRPVAETST